MKACTRDVELDVVLNAMLEYSAAVHLRLRGARIKVYKMSVVN